MYILQEILWIFLLITNAFIAHELLFRIDNVFSKKT